MSAGVIALVVIVVLLVITIAFGLIYYHRIRRQEALTRSKSLKRSQSPGKATSSNIFSDIGYQISRFFRRLFHAGPETHGKMSSSFPANKGGSLARKNSYVVKEDWFILQDINAGVNMKNLFSNETVQNFLLEHSGITSLATEQSPNGNKVDPSDLNGASSTPGRIEAHLDQFKDGKAITDDVTGALATMSNSDNNKLNRSALYKLQMNTNESSPENYDPDATYNLQDNVAIGKASVPLSVPGYLQLNYKTDFRWLTQGIGEGGTASISLAELIKPADIARNDDDPKVAVKHYLDLKNVDKSIIKTNFLYEIAILSSLQGISNTVKMVGYTEDPATVVMKLYQKALSDIIFTNAPVPIPVAMIANLTNNPTPNGANPQANAKTAIRDLTTGISAQLDLNLPVDLVFRIVFDIVKGMEEIHSMNVVHFDLKPQNVLVEVRSDGSFNCVICDFGFATIVPPEANIHNYLKNKKQKGLVPDEKTQVVRGLHRPNNAGLTAAYASPELWSRVKLGRRKSTYTDKSCDIYAFAITLWEVLNQTRAWAPLSPDKIERLVQNGERPPITNAMIKRYQKHKILFEMLQKCWAHQPELRPSFRRVLAGLGVFMVKHPDRLKYMKLPPAVLEMAGNNGNGSYSNPSNFNIGPTSNFNIGPASNFNGGPVSNLNFNNNIPGGESGRKLSVDEFVKKNSGTYGFSNK